jgi:hypothetical protein
MYLRHQTLPGGFAPNDGRDPSFELYSPPYLFRGARPQIASAPERPKRGSAATVTLGGKTRANDIASVVLVRNGTTTHVIDGDQRSVELPITKRRGTRLTVALPSGRAVLPPGPYLLFVNARTKDGLVPSKARQVMLGT